MGARLSRALFGNAYVMLVLATILWGGNSVAGKMAARDWQPFTLTALRWGFAGLVLLPFARRALRRDWPLIRRHLPLLVALGALGMCSFNLLMYLALNTTSAINVSIEQASMPGLIMIANFLLLSQRVRAPQVVGLLLSIVGVVVVTTAGDPGNLLAAGFVAGDGWMLLGCVFYAAYTFGLRWRPAIDWTSYMAVIAASAFVMALPFAAWEQMTAPRALPAIGGWSVLLYIVIFPTLIGQIAWARGVELVGSNRAGLFFNLIPIFGAALAVLLLGERFEGYHAFGLALVLGGIALAERSASRSRAACEASGGS